jgi:hypothetical protein
MPGGQPGRGRPSGQGGFNRGAVTGFAIVILAVIAVAAIWALSGSGGSLTALVSGPTATPVPPPTNTPAPTSTPQPGIGISIPGPQGTPTTIAIPLPIPPIPGVEGTPNITIPIPGANGTPGITLPIPGVSGSPEITLPIQVPGVGGGTQPPSAKLTADDARRKVQDSLGNCALLKTEIAVAQVTFEPPTWVVRLAITGGTWRVDDNTGNVTPDDRATERQRSCRA